MLAVLSLLVGCMVSGQAQAAVPSQTTAEIRINLPDGVESNVSVRPGSDRIELELPRGSVFPLDFAASSGGLLRGGQVIPVDDNRVRLELDLARGLLDRIDYEPGAIVLRFQTRFQGAQVEDTSEQYHLGPEDKIVVTVHNRPELTATLTVTEEGTITAPLVGDVRAIGLTPRELAGRLMDLLGRNYLVDPQVDVEVKEFMSQWVMVDGEVKLAGRVPLRGGTRLKEVLSEVGGFAETAGELISISRKVNGSTDYETFEVNRKAFENGSINPRLASGDIITVGRPQFCYVRGEVSQPSRVPIERGLTLLRALTQVGGLTDWANRKRVRILSPEGGTPRIYNLKQIQSGKVEDPLLTGGEIIIVDRRFF